jgi:hypothetical protein
MLAYTQRSSSGWRYWGLGVIASLSAFASSSLSPELTPEYPLCAVLTLVFFFGMIRSD